MRAVSRKAALAGSSRKALSPPVAARRPHTIAIGGGRGSLPDDLFWLRDDSRARGDVRTHLRRENAYTAQRTRHLGALAKELERELKSRMLETDVGLPCRDAAWFYFTRVTKGVGLPIHCRVAAASAAETSLDVLGRLRAAAGAPLEGEEVILDENELAAWAEARGGGGGGGGNEGGGAAEGAPGDSDEEGSDDGEEAGSDSGDEEAFCDVSDVELSPSGGLLAFSCDTSGAEVYTIFVRRLLSSVSVSVEGAFAPAAPVEPAPPGGMDALLPDEIKGTDGNMVWGGDDCTLFYVTLDASQRSFKAWRHTLGRPQGEDVCVFEEADTRFNLGLERSGSGDFVFLASASAETSEVRAIPLTPHAAAACSAAAAAGGSGGEALRGDALLLAPRRQGVMYSVAHFRGVGGDAGGGGKRLREPANAFLFLSNEGGALNFKLSAAALERPWAWRDIVPPSEARYLTEVSAHARFLALAGREGGLSAAWVASADAVEAALGEGGGGAGAPLRLEPLPPPPGSEAAYALTLLDPDDGYFAAALRFAYSSLKLPSTICEWPVASARGVGGAPAWGVTAELPAPGALPPHPAAPRVLYRDAVPNVDFAKYATARVFAPTADGQRVPVSLVFRPSAMARGGGGGGASAASAAPAPCLLHGYGAYGECEEPGFDDAALSLCDRGFVYAIAHVRGGGENGRGWYNAGKMLAKRNSFADFIAAGEHLCAAGWTAPGLLVAEGGSAGGLLVGVAVNERPQLWGGALLRVPFLDLLATMADPSLPLVQSEGEEWGDPAGSGEVLEYLRSYDPQLCVRQQTYPPMLLTAGYQDQRVGYWEAAKWVQRVRAAAAGSGEGVLLKIEMEEGHAGAMDRYKSIRDVAFELAWVLDQVKAVPSVARGSSSGGGGGPLAAAKRGSS
jgi:oligopeptidase B